MPVAIRGYALAGGNAKVAKVGKRDRGKDAAAIAGDHRPKGTEERAGNQQAAVEEFFFRRRIKKKKKAKGGKRKN